ncbi:phosphoribosylglycinamide formyltransferase [Dongshaea marina]|uniref:phosphoribosylglycinamide formyltransferase n=1 Tax=Dongshaea marina TaxID=2047966 RepID=UPI000D3EA0D6|nr:phosphoribosylglycinamide formyltransferase [Dongshaea marina]
MNKKILVLISGNGSNLQALIDSCEQGRINGSIAAVISNREDAYGLTRAKQHQIPAVALPHTQYENREQYDQALIEAIDRYQPDLVVLAGFMRILSAEFVHHYQGRLLNIHPSLLPAYPGLNSIQRALEAGEQEHGASVHFVTDEVDGGPVILQAKVPVFDEDDLEALTERVHYQEHQIYPLVVQWFCQERLTMQDGKSYLDDQMLPPSGYANSED